MGAAGNFNATTASVLNGVQPQPTQTLFANNYLSLSDMDFTQQFLPEVYEKEVERFGNRTISGFLRMVGAEMPMASDQVVWSEQGRLHVAYDDVKVSSATEIHIEGTPETSGSAGDGIDKNLLHAGQTVIIAASDGDHVVKAYVSAVGAFNQGTGHTPVTMAGYGTIDASNYGSDFDNKLFVYGSEYAKGT